MSADRTDARRLLTEAAHIAARRRLRPMVADPMAARCRRMVEAVDGLCRLTAEGEAEAEHHLTVAGVADRQVEEAEGPLLAPAQAGMPQLRATAPVEVVVVARTEAVATTVTES